MTDTAPFLSTRPSPQEHAPYYAAYIARVPDGEIVATLASQARDTLALVRGLPESLGGKRYAKGKWSIREVMGHIIDAERVFGYRAMRFARNDETELPGFDENLFVGNASFDNRSLSSLADEFAAVRSATVAFFGGLMPAEWDRSGTANRARMSVRALAWVIAGHELHHRLILTSRYL
jgi:hypothetical protein